MVSRGAAIPAMPFCAHGARRIRLRQSSHSEESAKLQAENTALLMRERVLLLENEEYAEMCKNFLIH